MTRPMAALLAASVLNFSGAHAQTSQAPLSAAAPASAADRSNALNNLFAEIWEDHLKRSPELASTLGDKRYENQLTDYSIAVYDQDRLSLEMLRRRR